MHIGLFDHYAIVFHPFDSKILTMFIQSFLNDMNKENEEVWFIIETSPYFSATTDIWLDVPHLTYKNSAQDCIAS